MTKLVSLLTNSLCCQFVKLDFSFFTLKRYKKNQENFDLKKLKLQAYINSLLSIKEVDDHLKYHLLI